MSRKEILRGQSIYIPERNGLEYLCFTVYEADSLLVLGNCASGKEKLKDILIGKISNYQGSFYWRENAITEKQFQDMIKKHAIFYANPDEVLIESYTISENIYVIHNRKKGILPSKRAIYIQTQNLLKELQFTLNPEEQIRELTYFQRLLVCIAKAVIYDSQIIIFDYMDTLLKSQELHELKLIIERLKQEGISFMIFGEKFDEISKLSNRTLIMSGGKDKKEALTDTIKKEEIPYYWMGEVYDRRRSSMFLDDGDSIERKKHILAVYDTD